MRLAWDKLGEKVYETGTDHGVLYLPTKAGVYSNGYAWNGLTAVTQSPEGAESNPQYADNIKYVDITSAEEFKGTIEAFTYPDEFGACDGTAEPTPGVQIGQQNRRSFGFSYRTLIGNDVEGTDFGYKLHLIYGAKATPSEKSYQTINDSPEAVTFSWELSTTPVEVGVIDDVEYKPTSKLTLNSTKVPAAKLKELEDILYGTAGVDPRLPLPGEVVALFAGTTVEVAPVAPTYNATTDTITIPVVAGVVYQIDGVDVTGSVVITKDTVVTAHPANGYVFPDVSDDDWFFQFA